MSKRDIERLTDTLQRAHEAGLCAPLCPMCMVHDAESFELFVASIIDEGLCTEHEAADILRGLADELEKQVH